MRYDPNMRVDSNDKKYLYNLQVLTLALLRHSFNDAVREGEWQSCIYLLEVFTIVFQVIRHINYFKAAILLQ